MFDILVFVVLAVVLPVLINKTTEEHFHWIKQYLRQAWTIIIAFGIANILWKPAIQEVIVKLHFRFHGLAGYVIAGGVGCFVSCLVWWASGKTLTTVNTRIIPHESAAKPNDKNEVVTHQSLPAPTPLPQASSHDKVYDHSEIEIKRRQIILSRLRNEYIISHDGLSPALLAGTEKPTTDWINKRLRELGETWRLADDTPTPPQLVFLYKDHRIEINNTGKTELEIWGTKLGISSAAMERTPTILPILPFNYHINADKFEQELLTKFGPSRDLRTPFLIFLKSDRTEWTVTCELWTVLKDNQIINIEARNLGAKQGWNTQ